ncbi:nucleotidyltransferase family protein [Halobacillus sp. Nhm2S1]|uniref:nucleotidyltransferase family protein n=1 Tax=Halobacillus sp. Nhm2S1 TaxID=2866716 RepID=UPI001C731B1B|nr:nucleotidyltransferase family protein [Halobacillus sp. Nhm2S1]MBX0359595.1 nucleotidyltransferase family protein [Halobacillus sp. Nhm2S1]
MNKREKQLVAIIDEWSPYVRPLFELGQSSTKECWIGAGIITQSVWNHQFGYPAAYGIGDADLLYFDASGTLAEEENLENQWNAACMDLPFSIDVTNEALVHLWYEEKFNQKIKPYTSVQDAIVTWPTTASSIGVKRNRNGEYDIYAPFGLEDLFQGIVRPNKRLIPKEVYWNKAEKWKERWPELSILPW